MSTCGSKELREAVIFSVDTENDPAIFSLMLGDFFMECKLSKEDFDSVVELINGNNSDKSWWGVDNKKVFRDEDLNEFEFYYDYVRSQICVRFFNKDTEITSPWVLLERYFKIDV